MKYWSDKTWFAPDPGRVFLRSGRRRNRNFLRNGPRVRTALTLLEMIIALAIMAIIFAAIMPQFRVILNSWDSKQAAAEILQNGRVLIDHLSRNLAKAVRITAVSNSSTTKGYIEFRDNDGNTVRYDVAANDYVEFGLVGSLSDLAGPVSQLQFTCYNANDFNTPTTDVNSIRLVKVQTTLTNSYPHGQNKTFTASVYVHSNGNNSGYGSLPVIVYGEENQAVPRYRTLSGSTWSAQQLANTVVGYPRWIVAARCPKRPEVAIGVLDDSEDLKVEFFNGFSWTAVASVTNNAVLFSERPFSMAYEQLSGKLLIGNRHGGGGKLFYRTYDGTTLSDSSNTSISGAGNPIWIRFVSKPASNEILAVILDSTQDVSGAVWNGSAWGNKALLENDTRTYDDECISAAYESQSGYAMVVWGLNGTDTFQYRRWTGSSWLTEGDGPNLGGGGYVRWLKLAADPASNQMILGVLDGNSDIRLIVWNGSSWGTPLLVETSAGGFDRRNFDIAYETGGTRAIAVWGRSGQNNCYYRTWNGSSWSSEQTGPNIGAAASVVQTITDPVKNRIFVNILNTNGEIKSMIWDGSSLSAPVTLVSDAGGENTIESFMVVPLCHNEDMYP